MKTKKMVLFGLPLLFLSCGYSKQEAAAADDFCMCASNKSFLQKTDCIKFAAGLNQVDVNAEGFKQAVKEKCSGSYEKMKKGLEKYKKQPVQ
jgi:hypothetical protein